MKSQNLSKYSLSPFQTFSTQLKKEIEIWVWKSTNINSSTCASNMAGLFLNHSHLKGSIYEHEKMPKNLVHFTISPQYPVIILSLVLSIICFDIFICWENSFDPVVWECALDSREGNLFKRKRSRRIPESLKTALRIFWHFRGVWRREHSQYMEEGLMKEVIRPSSMFIARKKISTSYLLISHINQCIP